MGRRLPLIGRTLLLAVLLVAGLRAQEAGAGSSGPQPVGPAALPTLPVKSQGARVGVDDLASLARHDDEVVVKVGEIELHRSDVFRVLDLAVPGRASEVIRQMVLTTAAQLDAQREGIDVPADEAEQQIERAIAEQKASFALEVDENLSLEEYLRVRHGMTAEQHRAEVRRMVLATMFLERAVRLDQLRSGYDQCQIILVEDEKLAREMAEQVRQGASFSVLARKNSVHPSAAKGGELPAVPPGGKVPLLEGRELLEPGGLHGPVPFATGTKSYWRLLRLQERVAPTAAAWGQLRASIEDGLSARPLEADELVVFEARSTDRYRVSRPARSP
jgi:peptidyl-prolyl cis-trans isomerase C